jgi:hypothetical protein
MQAELDTKKLEKEAEIKMMLMEKGIPNEHAT